MRNFVHKRGGPTGRPFYAWSRVRLQVHNPQQLQNNKNDCDDEQSMDPTAGLWKAGADISAKETEQPQDN